MTIREVLDHYKASFSGVYSLECYIDAGPYRNYEGDIPSDDTIRIDDIDLDSVEVYESVITFWPGSNSSKIYINC